MRAIEIGNRLTRAVEVGWSRRILRFVKFTQIGEIYIDWLDP